MAISLAEDLAVALVVWLATDHPWLAAGVAVVLLVCGVTLALFLAKAVRAGLRRLRARPGAAVNDEGPPGGGPSISFGAAGPT